MAVSISTKRGIINRLGSGMISVRLQWRNEVSTG